MRAKPAALMVRFFLAAATGFAVGAGEPRMETSSFSKALIFSLIAVARISWAELKSNKLRKQQARRTIPFIKIGALPT